MSKERKFTVSEAFHDDFVDLVVASEMERLVDMLATHYADDPQDKKIAKAAKRILKYYKHEGLV